MGETLPNPDNFSASDPELEQLADWIIRHEALPSEEKKPVVTQQSHETRTETDLEKRNEIKDSPTVRTNHNTARKPMVPLKEVLQTYPRSLLPETPSLEKQRVNVNRLRQIKPSPHPYATAVLYGFGAGLAIVLTSLVVIAIR